MPLARRGPTSHRKGMTTQPPFRIHGLGEVAIRCHDLPAMAAFYGRTLGLTRLRGSDTDPIVFFRIADGVAGHTTVLALFRDDARPATGPGASLHHLALSLPFAEQEAARTHFTATGVPFRIEHFDWIGWRGLFLTDPEGNTVELVAYDASRAPASS